MSPEALCFFAVSLVVVAALNALTLAVMLRAALLAAEGAFSRAMDRAADALATRFEAALARRREPAPAGRQRTPIGYRRDGPSGDGSPRPGCVEIEVWKPDVGDSIT